MYLFGSLHRGGPPSAVLWYPRQSEPYWHLCGGLGTHPGLRCQQVHPWSQEPQQCFQWHHPIYLRGHGFLQHFSHVGPSTCSGREWCEAPSKAEGLQDGAHHPGHHRGQLPAAGGSNALCVILHLCGVQLPDPHQRLLAHGPELQHRASPLPHQDGVHGWKVL